MYEVAFRRLLYRLELADPGRWMVKGGVALLLRLDPNRTSDDIDLVYLDQAGEFALAVRALERAFAIDDGDFIGYALIERPSVTLDDDGRDTLGLGVQATIGDRPWVRFDIDLSKPAENVPSEPLRARGTLTGLHPVDDLPELRALALPWQIAQKTCAIFERHGVRHQPSTRPRDLADIAMIAMQVDGIVAADLATAVAVEQTRRIERGTLLAPLGTTLHLAPAHEADWRRRWSKATRHVDLSFDDALTGARALLDPILGGHARGTWSAGEQRWA